MSSHANRSQHVQTIHVHCARSMACASGVPDRGIDLALYSERSLLMAAAGDIVCLHQHPDPGYLSYLNQLGIGPHPADLVVCPDAHADDSRPLAVKLAESPSVWQQLCGRLTEADEVLFESYMATRYERQLVERLRACLPAKVTANAGPCELVEQFDQKHNVRRVALELGVPVAPGEVVEVENTSDWFALASAIRRQREHTGKVIVRGAAGNGGSSAHAIADAGEVVRCLDRIRQADSNTVFLVEALVEVTSSPNIGLRIDPETRQIECVSCTEQVLGDGVAHVGNRYPLTETQHLPEMLAAAERFAEYLSQRGVVGHVGFDFCVHRSQIDGPGFLLAEINPRLNGATYLQTMFEALNRSLATRGEPQLRTYHSVVMPTSCGDFPAMRQALGSQLFMPGSEQGALPLSLGFLGHGKSCLALVSRHAEGLTELHERVASVLRPITLRRAA